MLHLHDKVIKIKKCAIESCHNTFEVINGAKQFCSEECRKKKALEWRDRPSVVPIKKLVATTIFLCFPLISRIGFRHLIHLSILRRRDLHWRKKTKRFFLRMKKFYIRGGFKDWVDKMKIVIVNTTNFIWYLSGTLL